MKQLLHSKFKLGADASAAAGPVGRDAQASTDLTMRAQVLTYSRARGLFLGVSLSGGVIKQDDADTQAFYGKDWTYYSLLRGEVPPPKDAEVLLNTVEKYAPTPRPHVAPTAAAMPAAEPATQADAATTASPAPMTASNAPAETATPVPDATPAAPVVTTVPAATPAQSVAPVAAPSAIPAATGAGGNR